MKDFRGFSMPTNAEDLNLDGTGLLSFAGASISPTLRSFSCRKTPLGGYQYLSLMACLAFGKTLMKVNQVPILAKTKSLASSLSQKIRPLIVDGWLIVALSPVRLIHAETRRHKRLFCDENGTGYEEEEVIEVFAEEEENTVEDEYMFQAGDENDERLRKRFYDLTARVLTGLPKEITPSKRNPSRAKSRNETKGDV